MTAPILTSEQFAVVAARDAEIATLRASRDAALARVAAGRATSSAPLWRVGPSHDGELQPEIAKAMGYDYYRQMFDVCGEAQKALSSPPPHDGEGA